MRWEGITKGRVTNYSALDTLPLVLQGDELNWKKNLDMMPREASN